MNVRLIKEISLKNKNGKKKKSKGERGEIATTQNW